MASEYDLMRHDAWVPVFGFAGQGSYIIWPANCQNMAMIGTLDKAARVRIGYAGH